MARSSIITFDQIQIGDKIELTYASGHVLQGFVANKLYGDLINYPQIMFSTGMVVVVNRRISDVDPEIRLLHRPVALTIGNKYTDITPNMFPVGSILTRFGGMFGGIGQPRFSWVVVNAPNSASGKLFISLVDRSRTQARLSSTYVLIYLPPWE